MFLRTRRRYRPRMDVRLLRLARVMHIFAIHSESYDVAVALALKLVLAACPQSGHVLGWNTLFIAYQHCIKLIFLRKTLDLVPVTLFSSNCSIHSYQDRNHLPASPAWPVNIAVHPNV